MERLPADELSHVLLTSDFPPIGGGESRALYHIFLEFPVKRKFVIAPWVEGCEEIDKKLPFSVIRYKVPSLFFRFFKIWGMIAGLTRVLKGVRGQIMIHCGQTMIPGAIGLIFKKLKGIPYIAYAHGGEFLKYKGILTRSWLKGVLRGAYKVWANSRFTKAQIINWGVPEKKVILTFLGVDIGLFRPLPKDEELEKKLGTTGKKVLLTVARIEDYKGIDMVIKALPYVLERVPNTIYIVVGEGPYKRSLLKIARASGVEEKVLFLGAVSDDMLRKLYNLCDVFIMPSRTRRRRGKKTAEGFGLVYLEANACGKPVIGGRSGGISDAVIDGVTGLLVDPENIQEIAEAIVKLLTDEELAERLGRQGLERVRKGFTWKAVAMRLYKALTKEGKVLNDEECSLRCSRHSGGGF